MNLEPVGYDGMGAPLWTHQTAATACPTCSTEYGSRSAAESCCGAWDGRGWD